MEEEFQDGNVIYRPDIITYNSVINAAANSFGDNFLKKKAFHIALESFKKALSSTHVQRTSRTYFLFLKAVRKLVNPGSSERDALVKKGKRFLPEVLSFLVCVLTTLSSVDSNGILHQRWACK
jgi:hypothetical protein